MIYFFFFFFFFNDTATTEIYTLSLHDALPIPPAPAPRRVYDSLARGHDWRVGVPLKVGRSPRRARPMIDRSDARRSPGGPHLHPWSSRDRKSTRLNSSHITISYAVFCLKK